METARGGIGGQKSRELVGKQLILSVKELTLFRTSSRNEHLSYLLGHECAGIVKLS